MSEKKGSWFSRLFRSKKEEQIEKVDEVIEAPVETVEPVVAEEKATSEASLAAVESAISVNTAALSESETLDIAPNQPHHHETIAEIEAEEIFEAVAENVVAQSVETGETVLTSAPEAAQTIADTEEKIAETIETAHAQEIAHTVEETIKAPEAVLQEKPKTGFFKRLKERLGKTRDGITAGLADLFIGKKSIDDDILEELETRLLMADVGVEVTQKLIANITAEVSRKNLSNVDELLAALNKEMVEILKPVEKPLVVDNTEHSPYVILMVGVNGVGKTTTIGKLAKKFQSEGKSVMLAAGDTFRAAAVEQLKVWGERNNIPVVAQKEGADPASVMFDAMESAKARKVDILIADTAGRLHTQAGLMQELAKIHRVMGRVDESAPHEVMLVVDASTGQNALNQATQFNEIVKLSGITFTKLDGTAKGGIIFAIADKLNVPVRFIGVGEAIDDLRPFEAESFVSAIVGQASDHA
ncbi:Signal recognition particle receptor FtsY [Wohlfahrtiimonas chitiniclastica SH04]|uniref:Signal recognition particle receptor FtsY n=1 Tax=Wohlfahrtiimonas chitiniclastica SH04 TaxID=1261130 RepID=L8XYR7_9GAMM|nr:signal recognition particle-docking protein FtsY [Wohlfahrtiimonas chitiniclastica]ELV07451.1 Signal recognition particle receptor FtsY [Wohlfahrtiimonas chitiniclastica SH04]